MTRVFFDLQLSSEYNVFAKTRPSKCFEVSKAWPMSTLVSFLHL